MRACACVRDVVNTYNLNIERKSIYAFRGRIQSSDNTIIKCMVNSVAPLVSNVWKWWRTTLYTGHVTV